MEVCSPALERVKVVGHASTLARALPPAMARQYDAVEWRNESFALFGS